MIDADVAELTRLRLRLFALSAENERLRNTISYQLGSAILRAKRLDGLLALPREIAHIVGESRQRRGQARNGEGSVLALDVLLRKILAEAYDASAEEIIATAESENVPPRHRAAVLGELAKILRPVEPAKAIALVRHAAGLDASPARSRLLAGMLVEAGQIAEPLAVYKKLTNARVALNPHEKDKLAVLGGMERTRAGGFALPARQAPRLAPAEPKSVMYVAAASLAYHTSGYTARTQALVKAIGNQGWAVHAVTRPGYPVDRNDVHQTPTGPTESIDGVTYAITPGPRSNATPFDRYCEDGATALYRHVERIRPALVHAASNYLNAAPALIAARRAGLPFVYEVRGLWELTHAAKDPAFERSERFDWQRRQETRVAAEADLVVAISQGLKRELVERGVEEDRIVVAPNCVDPDKFQPLKRDAVLAREYHLGDSTVLGFIGSMTGYEGLIDLVTALAELRRKGRDVCALLVGDGPAAQEVREAARSLGVQQHVIMPGRVPHADVARWYSVMDMTVYPRRPSKVTELVPPLKPLEAMAMGLPVVASDVSAIRESIVNGRNGFLFRRGDPASLVATLEEVMADSRMRRKVARQGRKDVQQGFTWASTAERLEQAYRERLGVG